MLVGRLVQRRVGRLAAVLLLAVSLTACGDSDDDEASASAPSATPAGASPSPSASGSYVAQVNALCEAMIDKVMAVRGDSDSDGGGDFPSMDSYEQEELQIRSIHEEFDAEVDALPVSDAERPAADAFDAFRDTGDADAEKLLTAARSGDQATYDAAFQESLNSTEFEAKRRAMNEAGIECPAR